MRLILLAAVLAAALPSMGRAQDRAETLADIRQELSVLYVEVQRLKRELSATLFRPRWDTGEAQRVEGVVREYQLLH